MGSFVVRSGRILRIYMAIEEKKKSPEDSQRIPMDSLGVLEDPARPSGPGPAEDSSGFPKGSRGPGRPDLQNIHGYRGIHKES